jgi:nucleotide-binding universal stress UspA family protein
MFRRILVPLDGSTRAESAIPVATRIARASKGSIMLLQVINSPIEYGMYLTQPSVLTEKDVEGEKARATEYLNSIAQSEQLEGIGTKIEVVVGPIATALLSYAEPSRADLIVMCSHGYTGFKRWVLGSVADKVIRYTPVPVLVLHDTGPLPAVSGHPLRILVALDGSPLSEAVLDPVTQLVATLSPPSQGALHLLRVVDVPPTSGAWRSQTNISADVSEHIQQDAKAYLASVVAQLQADFALDYGYEPAITASVVTDADVAGAIIKEAESTEMVDGYELIAMSTHGRGGLERWTAGSVTERTLHGTKLPLFIVRPQEAAQKKRGKGTKEEKKETSTTTTPQDEKFLVGMEVEGIDVETWAGG